MISQQLIEFLLDFIEGAPPQVALGYKFFDLLAKTGIVEVTFTYKGHKVTRGTDAFESKVEEVEPPSIRKFDATEFETECVLALVSMAKDYAMVPRSLECYAWYDDETGYSYIGKTRVEFHASTTFEVC